MSTGQKIYIKNLQARIIELEAQQDSLSPDAGLVEALQAVLDVGDEGCCEECMDKDNIAKQALAKYRKGK
jgi:hypothetical protein